MQTGENSIIAAHILHHINSYPCAFIFGKHKFTVL